MIRDVPHVALRTFLACVGTAFCVHGAAGQTIEEIIVVATKRPEAAQQVGLAVTALGEDDYRELTDGLLSNLSSLLTNTQAYASDTFLQSVHVRGIGLNEFQGQYDSPVAQHIDEVYLSKPWMTSRPQYDIERVEVLKGPQGTLFGRNTTGGAINYYRATPGVDTLRRVTFGLDEHQRYLVEGVLNGALREGLSGRFSFRREFGDGGPQKNLYDGSEHGEPDVLDMRAQLLWQGESIDIRALVHGGYDEGEKIAWKGPGLFNFGAPGFCPALLSGSVSRHPSACAKTGGLATLNGFPEGEFEPEDTFTVNQNTPPRVDDTFYGGYLRVDYDGAAAALTSITAFEFYERIQEEDSASDIFDSTSTHYYNEIRQVTQELRMSGELDRSWQYVVGLFYEHDSLDQVDGSDFSEQQLPGITPPFADQLFGQFALELDSFALFADTEHQLLDALAISVGARYTKDRVEVEDVLLGIGQLPQVGDERFVTPCLITTFPQGPVGAPACPFLGPEAPLFAGSREDDDVSFRLGVEWSPAADVLVYGNIATAYRAGGFSLPFGGAATDFAPEDLLAQEVGFKAALLDDTMRLSASIFHYDYDDVQVNVDDPVSPLVPITRNIGAQQSVGAEVEWEWLVDGRWYVRQGVGYLDAEFDDTDRAVSTYSGVIPLDGKRPVNSPEWTYNGVLRYEQPVSASLFMSVMFDYEWIDERFLEATNQPFDLADSYFLANARVVLGALDGRWEVSLYARNLTDEEYLVYTNNIPFFKLDIFGEPRTVGARVRVEL